MLHPLNSPWYMPSFLLWSADFVTMKSERADLTGGFFYKSFSLGIVSILHRNIIAKSTLSAFVKLFNISVSHLTPQLGCLFVTPLCGFSVRNSHSYFDIPGSLQRSGRDLWICSLELPFLIWFEHSSWKHAEASVSLPSVCSGSVSLFRESLQKTFDN